MGRICYLVSGRRSPDYYRVVVHLVVAADAAALLLYLIKLLIMMKESSLRSARVNRPSCVVKLKIFSLHVAVLHTPL